MDVYSDSYEEDVVEYGDLTSGWPQRVEWHGQVVVYVAKAFPVFGRALGVEGLGRAAMKQKIGVAMREVVGLASGADGGDEG